MSDTRTLARDLLIIAALKAEVEKRESALRADAKDALDPGDRKAGFIGDAKIGAVTYTDPSGSFRVTDGEAWKAWVKANRPDEIVSSTVENVRTSFEAAMLERGCDDNGEPLPGVAWVDPTPVLQVKAAPGASEAIRAALADRATIAKLIGGVS